MHSAHQMLVLSSIGRWHYVRLLAQDVWPVESRGRHHRRSGARRAHLTGTIPPVICRCVGPVLADVMSGRAAPATGTLCSAVSCGVLGRHGGAVATRWRFPRSTTRFAGSEKQDRMLAGRSADSSEVIQAEPFLRLANASQIRSICAPLLVPTPYPPAAWLGADLVPPGEVRIGPATVAGRA